MATKNSGNEKKIAIALIVVLIGALVAWVGSVNSQEFAGLKLFALAVVVAYVVQWIAFIPAFALRTEKFFDLLGGATYFTLTLALVLMTPQTTLRAGVIAVCVMLWSARLASFLFQRVKKSGKDGRFDDIKHDPLRFFNVWTIQGLWITFTAAAAWVGITARPAESESVDVFLIIGALLWIVGFAIEVVADTQKSRFRQDPSNKEKFITTGLWKTSRHPNYFGEILLWLGIAVMAFPAMTGWSYVALFSPVFVFILLRFVSGVPLLEKRADKRWGGQPDYESYKASTPVLAPLVGKKN